MACSERAKASALTFNDAYMVFRDGQGAYHCEPNRFLGRAGGQAQVEIERGSLDADDIINYLPLMIFRRNQNLGIFKMPYFGSGESSHSA